jgi:hypothetical protein
LGYVRPCQWLGFLAPEQIDFLTTLLSHNKVKCTQDMIIDLSFQFEDT